MKSESLDALTTCFRRLPGVGLKSAMRYAYSIIETEEEKVEAFAKALLDVKKNIKLCEVCGNYTEQGVCAICSGRDKEVICVVRAPKDISAFERRSSIKRLPLPARVHRFSKRHRGGDIRIKGCRQTGRCKEIMSP